MMEQTVCFKSLQGPEITHGAHLPSCVINRPGGSYLWPSSAFISSSVNNGSNSPVSSLSVRGAGIFLGPLTKCK